MGYARTVIAGLIGLLVGAVVTVGAAQATEADPDGDGLSDDFELGLGTDPFDDASGLVAQDKWERMADVLLDVLVEAAARQSGLRHDVIDRYRIETVFVEQPSGCLNDSGAGFHFMFAAQRHGKFLRFCGV